MGVCPVSAPMTSKGGQSLRCVLPASQVDSTCAQRVLAELTRPEAATGGMQKSSGRAAALLLWPIAVANYCAVNTRAGSLRWRAPHHSECMNKKVSPMSQCSYMHAQASLRSKLQSTLGRQTRGVGVCNTLPAAGTGWRRRAEPVGGLLWRADLCAWRLVLMVPSDLL